MRRAWRGAIVICAAMMLSAGAQGQDPIDRIRESDIRDDLFTLAGDAMRGREGGTLDEMVASVWLAERARAVGMQPAGDNGTFFQFFPVERMRVASASTIVLGGKPLQMGRDVIVDAPIMARVDAPVLSVSSDAVTGPDVKPELKSEVPNRALVVRYTPRPGTGGQQAMRAWLRGLQKATAAMTPAAIVAIVPEEAADQWARVAVSLPRGTYALDPDGTAEPRLAPRGTPLLYVREAALGAPLAADARLTASLFTDSFTYPSVNVIAKVPGRDPASLPPSTCCSAPIRITTASVSRSTATRSGTAPTTTPPRRLRCWRSAARCRRCPDGAPRCSCGTGRKSAG